MSDHENQQQASDFGCSLNVAQIFKGEGFISKFLICSLADASLNVMIILFLKYRRAYCKEMGTLFAMFYCHESGSRGSCGEIFTG